MSAADLQFRPWEEGDDVELLQIWGDPEGSFSGWYRSALEPSSDGDEGRAWKRCIVATDQGIPVAAGAVWEQQLHSERLSAYVEVARDHRRQGVGAMLLGMLRNEAKHAPSGKHELTVKADLGSAAEAFARSAGLSVVQTSSVIEVAAGALALPRFPQREDQTEEDAGSDLVQDLATGSVELMNVVRTWYEAMHRGWSPTGEISPGLTQQLLLSDAAGAQGAIVLRSEPESAFGVTVAPTKKGKIRSFVVSYGPYQDSRVLAPWSAEDSAADVMLGWDPELDDEEAELAARDLLALVAYQHPVVLEVDSSMGPLRAVVEPLVNSGKAVALTPETLIFAG